MKKKLKILSGLLISVSILSTTALAYNSYDYMGWSNVGKPIYTKSSSSVLSKSDVSGTTIMSRLRKSYSYENRMPKIANSRYKQSLLWIPSCPLDGYTFTDKTYLPTPYNGGEIGYTEWYDSQYGVFLDYETGNIKGTIHDKNNRPPKSVKQDFIDYANVQFPNGSTDSAYIVTSESIRELADAKSAAAIARSDNKKHYPIYANGGTEIDSDVKVALKNKNIKNLYILGGIQSFSITAGLTGDFNIIRCGGLERNDTQELLRNLPKQMNNPGTYKGDVSGIVMEGIPERYKAKIREYLMQEKSRQNASNLIMASEYIMTKINGVENNDVGARPNSNSTPTIVIGVNDGAYETYWMGYWSSTQGQYVYQYVLGNYYSKTILNSDVVSVEGKSLYKQNGSTYWTNTKDSFSVNTRGTISTKYDLGGIGLHFVNQKFGAISNSPKHEITTNAFSNNSTFNTDFTNKTSIFAKKGTYNGLNSITGKHTVTAKLDSQVYRLYSSTQYGYWSNPKDSGITIKTDGIAPLLSGIPSSAWTKNDVSFSINATDSQSGVKSLVVKKGDVEINKNYNETKEGIHSYTVTAIDNVSNTANNTFTIKIDKTAPTGEPSFKYDEVKGTLDVKVDDVVEVGSGVKDIWIELSQEDDPNNVIKESLTLKEDGTYTTTTDVFEKFEDKGKIKVEVKAEDIVGNIGDLGSNDIDIFKVEAIVERVLEPHTPIFKGGEKGILKIKLYGGVDKYRITFPQALSELDDTLNIEKSITPQKTTEIEYEFFIPIDAPKGNYNVTVDGYKKGIKKSAHPGLEVDGTITDRLRTRIRLPQRR